MRPQTLTLKAFGPYMDETIDFSSFYGNNIFLIAGNTGSGKTTLFDGICFALFGKTNGSNREPKEMRSTFASSKEETSVTFTFASQNKRYEITRSPAQILLKVKGDGTREVPAKASISVYNDEGEELQQFTKISEVDAVVEEVVQLNSDQFRQIVMIPQGEFRRFLNADSGEKEMILRKLFGTDIYRQLSDKLKEQKKEASLQLVEKEKQLETVLSKAHWSKEKPETETSGFSGLKEEFEWLKEEQTEMATQLAELKTALERLNQEATSADHHLIEQQTVQGYLDEQKELGESLQQLDKTQPQVEVLRDLIKSYEQAKSFEPLISKIKEAGRELDEALQKEAAVKQRVADAKETLKKQQEIKAQFEKEQPEQDKRTERLIKLDHLQESIEQYQESKFQSQEQEKVVSLLEEEKAQYAAEQQELKNEKNRFKQRLEDLSKKQQQLYKNKDTMQHWQQGHDLLGKLLRQKEEKNQLKAALQTKKSSLDEAQRKLQQAQAEYKQAKSNWAKVQIQKLAADLVAGEPCPVCGSTEHPMHVEQSDSGKTGIELERILEEKEKCVTDCQTENEVLLHTLSQMAGQLKQKEEKIAQQTKLWIVFSEQLPLIKEELSKQEEELAQWISDLSQQLEQTTAELEKQHEITEKHTSVKNRLEQSQVKMEGKTQQLQTAISQKSQLTGRFEQLQQGIPEQYLDTQRYMDEVRSVKEARDSWSERYEKERQSTKTAEKILEQHQYTFETIQKTIAEIKEKQLKLNEQLHEELKKTLFSSAAEVEKQLKNKAHIADWQEEINQFEKDRYNIQQNLLKTKQKLAGKPEPKVAEAKEASACLKKQSTQKNEVIILLQEHHRQNEQVLKAGETILSQQQQAVQFYTEIAELSDVANGDTGTSKLGFERYVLSYYLEEVLQIANQRLQKLSNNRYWFDLNRENGSYKNKTGLEINIYDDHAGGVRNVGTLSGGESFIAALSLALSLSDVVQRQAGGIQIEAVFIDEGFGSLDEDALDKAVEALMQIDGDGKIVGIISHVKELKERIPDKVLVKALGTGKSQLEVIHA